MKKQLFYLILFLVVSTSFSNVLKDEKVENYNDFFNFYYEEKQDKIYLEVEIKSFFM
ncbi:MAG: hypothetical protein WA749_06545 [Gelidibacter sp.]